MKYRKFSCNFRKILAKIALKISKVQKFRFAVKKYQFRKKIHQKSLFLVCVSECVLNMYFRNYEFFIPEVQKYFVIDFERKNVIFELRKVEFLVIWNISNIFIWREK